MVTLTTYSYLECWGFSYLPLANIGDYHTCFWHFGNFCTFTFSDGPLVGRQLNLTQCIAIVPQRGGVEGRGGGTCFLGKDENNDGAKSIVIWLWRWTFWLASLPLYNDDDFSFDNDDDDNGMMDNIHWIWTFWSASLPLRILGYLADCSIDRPPHLHHQLPTASMHSVCNQAFLKFSTTITTYQHRRCSSSHNSLSGIHPLHSPSPYTPTFCSEDHESIPVAF